MDLTRFNSGLGVVLFNHDRDKILGKILSAKIEDGRGIAVIEFDDDEDSEKILKKVRSGTLKGVSVGYSVSEWSRVQAGETSADGVKGPAYIARKWTPYEISIVSVPADASVGVGREAEPEITQTLPLEAGRSENTQNPKEGGEEDVKRSTPEVTNNVPVNSVPEASGERAMQTAAPVDTSAAETAARDAERTRVSEIVALCRDFSVDADQYISGGQTVDQVRAAILDGLKANRGPVATHGAGDVNVTGDAEDKFRAAAADGLLMRGGITVENPAAGAEEFRGASLRDLAVMIAVRNGEKAERLLRTTEDEMYARVTGERQFYAPTAAFPAILDTAIKKAYVQGHKLAPVTFDHFTSKGSLKDFKTVEHNYIAGPVGEFELIPEGGELKHDIPKDALRPTRKLATYGKQFTMTREAFINDDIGFLSTMPARYAAAARKTINGQVYKILFNNPVIYDGVQLFDAAHKNVLGTGAAPSMALVQKMILALGIQKDEFGQAIMIRPATIVCGLGYGMEFYKIFHSATVQTTDNTQAVNPLTNYASMIDIVEDATLNALAGSGACPWFLIADCTDCSFIQVDYLNGNEIPTIRRMETPGQLGYVWDVYLDWGITVLDYRGAVKNPGDVIPDPLS